MTKKNNLYLSLSAITALFLPSYALAWEQGVLDGEVITNILDSATYSLPGEGFLYSEIDAAGTIDTMGRGSSTRITPLQVIRRTFPPT